jgi:lysophospholipase L1-like esterase
MHHQTNQLSEDTARSRQPLSTRRKIFFATVSLLLFFAIAETIARIVVAIALPGELRETTVRSVWADEGWQIDSLLGWTLTPDSTSNRGGAECRTNDLGLRDGRIPIEKPKGELRVLSIGDSTVLGFGVAAESSFSERLEKKLNAALPCPVEVINAGVPGYASTQTVLYLESQGIAFEPDVVIFESNFNDRRAVPPGGQPDSVEGFRLISRKLVVFEALDKSMLGRLFRKLFETDTIFGSLLRTGSYAADKIPIDAPPRVSIEHFEANLRRAIDVSEAAGARLILVGLPDNPHAVADLLRARDHIREQQWADAELALLRAAGRPLTSLAAHRMLNELLEQTNRKSEFRQTIPARLDWLSTDGYTPVSLSEPYINVIERVGRDRSAPVVIPRLGSRREDGRLYLDYIHLNGPGHELLANELTEVVMDLLDGCRVAEPRDPLK